MLFPYIIFNDDDLLKRFKILSIPFSSQAKQGTCHCHILILRLVGQWRSLGIDSCAKLLVEHIETIAVVLDHAKVVDDVLGVLLFLHLLIYKPLEHALCGIVILLGSESEEVVDEGGNLLLVCQG